MNNSEVKNKYEYSENCCEISGFGGEYEQMCRNMVKAGMIHLDENPESKPTFEQFKNVYGITTNENEDMKKLQDAMVKVCEGCSGAMMQATTNHVLYANKNGWEKYIEEMEKNKEDEE